MSNVIRNTVQIFRIGDRIGIELPDGQDIILVGDEREAERLAKEWLKGVKINGKTIMITNVKWNDGLRPPSC